MTIMTARALRAKITLLAALALPLAGAATFMTVSAGPAAAAVRAAESVPEAYCTYPSGSLCMNRDGGGTSQGTAIIGWADDGDGNEYFVSRYDDSGCDGDIVQDGENGCLWPFSDGSGLNSRYDGDSVVYFQAYSGSSSVGCVGETSEAYATLFSGCLPDGAAMVLSDTNGAFLIDVQVSDYWYGQGDGSDKPYWLVAGSEGQQLYFTQSANNSWGCVGSGC